MPVGVFNLIPVGGFYTSGFASECVMSELDLNVKEKVNMKVNQVLLAVTLVSAASFAQADYKVDAKTYSGQAQAQTAPAKAEIAALFDRWNAALATGNPDEVAKLYAKNGILQPTVSNHVRTTPAEIKEYFEHFLPLKPQGVINSREIRVLDANTALDSGVYTFSLVKENKPVKVQARYTYLYEKINGQWKIMNHHSSAMPEKVDETLL